MFIEGVPPPLGQKLSAWTQLVAYPEDHELRYIWQAPSGKIHLSSLTIKKGWAEARAHCPVQLAWESGVWTVKVVEPDLSTVLLEGTFTIP